MGSTDYHELRGRRIWTLVPYLPPVGAQTPDSPTPPTVNPSLWRQAQLNSFNGLFEVCEGIYQIRAFDMSNMTVIEGRTGLIVIDPLISVECAQSALKLYRDNRPSAADLEVTAVIYTHSHIDHFGGVEGIMPLDPAKRAAVEIYAPEGFMEHAISENVYAGCAMGRRAQYMYGPILPKDDKGQVDTGLGKGQSTGSISPYPPTVDITQTGDEFDIAGVRVVFHMTQGSEASAEMDFYVPDFKAFCAAENATHNMHNIQTLRGANVRDALKWSKYLGEALELFGEEAEVLFASHHWPIWGQANIADFLSRQRDMYRYLNDQTLRMLNEGYTGIELAEVFEMPASLADPTSLAFTFVHPVITQPGGGGTGQAVMRKCGRPGPSRALCRNSALLPRRHRSAGCRPRDYQPSATSGAVRSGVDSCTDFADLQEAQSVRREQQAHST